MFNVNSSSKTTFTSFLTFNNFLTLIMSNIIIKTQIIYKDFCSVSLVYLYIYILHNPVKKIREIALSTFLTAKAARIRARSQDKNQMEQNDSAHCVTRITPYVSNPKRFNTANEATPSRHHLWERRDFARYRNYVFTGTKESEGSDNVV